MKLDEKKCPRCAEAIKAEALVCKNCGHEFSPAEVAAASKKASRDKLTGYLGCGGLVAVLFLAIGMCSGPDNRDVRNSSETTASVEPAAVRIATRVESVFAPVVLNLELDAGNARSGAVIAAAGEAVLQVGKEMIAGRFPKADGIETLGFTVLGRSGNNSAVGRKITHFSIGAQELRELASAGVSGDVVLDRVREPRSWTPANDDVVKDYCSSRPGSSFCQEAM